MCERQVSNHANLVRKLEHNSIQTYLFNHLSYQLFICQIYLSDMLVTKSEKLIWNLNLKCYQFHHRCWKSRVDLFDEQMWFLKYFKKQKYFKYWYEIVDIENSVKRLIDFSIRILMLSLKQKRKTEIDVDR